MNNRKDEIINEIKKLEEEKDKASLKARLQDTFQHAYKIFLNSVYGFTGTQFSPIYNKDMAESVTLTGQTTIKEMVQFTNKCLNKLGNTENTEWVIAGDTDSVSENSKININNKNILIKDLFNLVCEHGYVDKLENGTEVAIPCDTFVTKSMYGYTTIKNVSRHKVTKDCYNISIPDHESLKITEDHSIMVYRNDEVIECKPNEIKKTDLLIILEK